jgi:hypothetical protein
MHISSKVNRNEKIFLAIIVGIIGIHIITQIIAPLIIIQSMIIDSEESTGIDSKDKIIRNHPTVLSVIQHGLDKIGFILFVTFVGAGIWIPWTALATNQLPTDSNTFFYFFFFWIISMLSFPLIFKYSQKISLWRRFLYIYLIPVLVSGLSITYFTPLGS